MHIFGQRQLFRDPLSIVPIRTTRRRNSSSVRGKRLIKNVTYTNPNSEEIEARQRNYENNGGLKRKEELTCVKALGNSGGVMEDIVAERAT